MYILDEEDYIRNILASNNKPSELSFGYFLTLIAKYYKQNCDSPESLAQLVMKKILDFDIDGYQEYKYAAKIKEICYSIFVNNLEFKKLGFIPIYFKDIDIIQSLPDKKYKKLLFTIYAIARYMNCDGWTNKKNDSGIAEIFKLANIRTSKDKQNEMLHYLYVNNYISFAKANTNQNIKVDISEEYTDNDIAYKITSFENIGNQYILLFEKKKIACAKCNRLIISNQIGRPKMYCKKCAEIINREKTAENIRIRRKNKEENM